MNLLGLGWASSNSGQGAMSWKEDSMEQLRNWEPELETTGELEVIGELGATLSDSFLMTVLGEIIISANVMSVNFPEYLQICFINFLSYFHSIED